MSKPSGNKPSTTAEEEGDITIGNPDVVDKYKTAGEVVNRVLAQLVAKTVDGASVLELSKLGDSLLTQETGRVFKSHKSLKKGIAFPTCISVNHVVCHNSPLESEEDQKLKTGDVVKIDLGAHVDGYVAVSATTVVIGASKENPVTGRAADVIKAAYESAELAARLFVAGGKNFAVTDGIATVTKSYECKPVEGMLSHQLERNKIDGEKAIVLNPNEHQRKETKNCTFEEKDVFCIDVLVSTGDGKPKQAEGKVSIFKRTSVSYLLKMAASRKFYSDAQNKFGDFPFTLRAMEDEKKARMGVAECQKHQLIEAYPVFSEKVGEIVAQFKFTVLLTATGAVRITDSLFDIATVKSEKAVKDEAILALLAAPIAKKSKPKTKKKTETTPAADASSSTTAAPSN